MKLNDVRPTIETSGDLEEQFFSIQDQGMIFDILRNKMYSNPILAICREITCNARDAHREVGTPEIPIHIHLPNNLEQYYKIKDFGPGISPERMSNIFIKYTASTKRDSNVQTGGFGLGAKTPFSYSDTFTILTNYNGKQYNYACFIDETKVGKLALLSESPTKEPNGTEIIIPVKHADFRHFSEWTEQATRHWKVRPIIKGGTIVWKELKKILEGTNWAMAHSEDYNRTAKMVIDGIEYPLEMSALKTYADSKLIDSSRGNLILYFGVGELSLSASREQIYLDKATQTKIKIRLDEIISEIKQKAVDKINSFPNLWDANVYYRKELTQAFNDLKFLGKLNWKGVELHNDYVSVKCPVFHFVKGKNSYRGSDPNKITRKTATHIYFDEGSVLFFNDLSLKEPTPRHVKKAFEDNPKLTSVQVIITTDKVSKETLNKEIHLDKMAPQSLSSITKASGRAYTPASSRLLVFKFDAINSAFRQVSYASLEEDTKDKVICMLTKDSGINSRQIILQNKRNLSLNSIKSLISKFPQTSFYGVDESTPTDRLKEEFSDFEEIDTFLTEKVVNNKNINYTEIKFAMAHNYDIDEKLLRHYLKLKTFITNNKSLSLQRLELHYKIKGLCGSDLGLLHIYESVNGEISAKELEKFLLDNPDYDVSNFNKLYEKKYPLMLFINSYNYENILGHIAQYINLIDKI